jgi:DNA (cytosine-5)-methyltransferase 1
MGINVLSVFDGMSCCQIALERAGISVNRYYASEIDKYSKKVTMSNYPDTIQLGDVQKVFAKDLEKIDLLCGGSPCQGFSFAGKGLNFDDPRSKLFFEFVRLLNECKPKWFLFENVPMKRESELIISQYLKVAPIKINSSLLSAQNRQRSYWTNINQVPWGLFGDMITDIPQPKDKCIKLKDVLEKDVPDKYFLSDKMLSYFENRASNFNGGKINIRDENGKASALLASSASIDISDNFISVPLEGNSGFLCSGRSAINNDSPFIVASRGRKNEIGTYVQELEARFDDKTNAITSVEKDNLLYITHRLRRLTPTECERLQTVPEGYTKYVSDTQRYKMLGNGWTVDVISYILRHIKAEL